MNYIFKYLICTYYISILRTANSGSIEFRTQKSVRKEQTTHNIYVLPLFRNFIAIAICFYDLDYEVFRPMFSIRSTHSSIPFAFAFASGLLANDFTFHILYYLRFTFRCRCTNNELSHLFESLCVCVWKMEWVRGWGYFD